jgi:broad specificity phosphatase PhoE
MAQHLWIARHGQSAGNVARDAAEANSLLLIDIADRDVDVPLSPLGERQAAAMSSWFATLPAAERPTVLLFSPYVRARGTAQAVLDVLDQQNLRAALADERLREKEFGILDRLTPLGIRHKHPELDEQRRHVGKFYFRPPGGESWCDVILRLRGLIDTIRRDYGDERVLLVAHQVIVNCLRYLIEELDEAAILAIDKAGDVPNCGVTDYRFDAGAGKHGKLVLVRANFVAPLEQAGTPVTTQPDMPAAPKA